ncbi:mariner Mos1 transposase [Trichonephila clavipes]|nr:mariner Mos1 transposase [Trichonephila clavipes]
MNGVAIVEKLTHAQIAPYVLKRVSTTRNCWGSHARADRNEKLMTTFPKPSIHQRKVLLCLWWDRNGPVCYELLKQGKTINADLYCNQLDKLNAAIKEKRPELASRKGKVFHHDNVQPHTAMVTQQKLNALGWEVLGHPPYSPDIAPSDYYLFRSLQNYLTEKKFKSFESVSKAVADYFNSKDENFYKIGIYMLP